MTAFPQKHIISKIIKHYKKMEQKLDNQKKCLICGIGNLTKTEEMVLASYKGIERKIPLHGSVCDYCKSEQADFLDVAKNKKIMDEFKQSIEDTI